MHVKIWRDPDFQEYPPDGKLIFVYLLTNPDLGESGLYAIAPRTISHDTGIKQKRVLELLNGNLKNVLFDEGTSTVFVVKYLTYNQVRGGQDLRVKAIETERATIFSPLWKVFDELYEFSNKYGYVYRGLEAPVKGITTNNNTTTIISTSNKKGEEKFSDWLNAWNELSPGPKHSKLGANGIKYIDLLTTEGAADGIVWNLEMFTTAVKIYGQAIRAGRWGYKWPSLVDLLSRTYNQRSSPGLTHFLPREGYNPYRDLGLQTSERR